MASVYRRTYLVVDPKSGKKVKRKRRRFTVKYKDASGRHRTCTGYKDKEASLQLGRSLELRAERESAGLRDHSEAHLRRPLEEHVPDFGRYLESKGDCRDHVKRSQSRILTALEGCDFKRIGDIAASPLLDYLAKRRETEERFGKATSNHYIRAMTALCRWLVREQRAPFNPLAGLALLNTEDEQGKKRRALEVDEFSRLLTAARDASDHWRIKIRGPDREMLYLVASHTGFRASELASMTPESFNLEAAEATVEARYSKRKRRDTQPLRSDLVAILEPWLTRKPAGERVWPGRWQEKAAEMLRRDLERAGIPYVHDGLTFDFHGLRYSYITSLHRGGTYGKLLQSLARHSTPMLTSSYTHVDMHDLRASLSGLPAVPKPTRQTRKATRVAPPVAPRIVALRPRESKSGKRAPVQA